MCARAGSPRWSRSCVPPGRVRRVVACVAGCSAAGSDPGADALMRLQGAQFYRGKPPSPGAGPAVTQLSPSPGDIRRGPNDAVTGFVDRTATAVAVWLEGDVGYWVVHARPARRSQLNQLGFAPASYAAILHPLGSYTVSAAASDIHGHFGAVTADQHHHRRRAGRRHAHRVLGVGRRGRSRFAPSFCPTAPRSGRTRSTRCRRRAGQPSDPNGYKDGGILDY